MTTRSKISAGLLLYRRPEGRELEVLLVHPGGPFFARRDEGYWSIPKGEPNPDEALLACAIREFEEEIGVAPTSGRYVELGTVQQRGGKLVHAWAFEGDWTGQTPTSNVFEIEWPPRSGKMQSFPEIDRAEFFSLGIAARKINEAQGEFLRRLAALVAEG